MKLSIVRQRLTAILMLVFSMSFLTSCNNDNDEPKSGEYVPESGTVESFNDVQWFADNIVLLDSDGNLKEYLRGRILDEATPQSLYIGVDTEAEAAEIFRSWLAPGSESELSLSADGSMTYAPTDEDGKKQGEIYYKPSGSNEKTISGVTFSTEIKIGYVNEIKFISNDLWPDNEEIINPYSVGDIYEFTINIKKCPWNGRHKAVCVKEATKDEPGYLVCLSDVKSYGDYIDEYYPWIASPAIAKEVSERLRGNWDFFDGIFKSAGMTLSKDDFYWITPFEKKLGYNRRFGIRLKDSKIDWFDVTWRKPKKPIMMVQTFRYS